MTVAFEQPFLFEHAESADVAPAKLSLRPYQLRAISGIAALRRRGARVLVVAPTGAGKTVIGSQEILDELALGGRVLFLAHRQELIAQTYGKVLVMGLSEATVGVIMGDGVITHPVTHRRVCCARPRARVQIASIDTLRNRPLPPGITLIIIDEAHRALAKSYRDVVNAIPEAFVIGLTATPYRGDGRGLGECAGGVFNELLVVAQPRELIADGFLAEPRVFSHPKKPDLSEVKITAGDYNAEQLDKAVNKSELIGNIVEHFKRHLDGVRTVAFAASVSHSKSLTEAFVADGIPAEHLDGETPADMRTGILNRLDRGETLVVSNAMVLCLDAETEILTSSGWVGIDAMTPEHLVANWDAGDVTFETPSEIIRRDRATDERMVSVYGERINVRVTEGHGLLYRTKLHGQFLKSPARDLVDRVVSLPVSGHAAPLSISPAPAGEMTARRRTLLINKTRYNLRALEQWPAETLEGEAARRVDRRAALHRKAPAELSLDECRFIGFWLGDGSRNQLQSGGMEYVVAQSFAYPIIIEWFEALVGRLGVHCIGKTAPPASKTIHPSRRWSFPRGTGGGSQERPGLFSIEPYLEKDGSPLLWGLSGAQFDALIEGLWLADGDHRDGTPKPPGKALAIHNTNRPFLDTLQAIAVVRGYGAGITLGSNQAKNPAHKQDYVLRLKKKVAFFMAWDRFAFEGDWHPERVWCVRTRTKNIITRRGGKVVVMGNCEGWDQPAVKGCILACPTKSPTKYIQCAGRVLRPYHGQTPIILDHGGCAIEHDLPHVDREYSLEGKKKREKSAVNVVECPQCFGASPKGTLVCPYCGTPLVKASEAVGGRTLEERDGQLVELVASALPLKKLPEDVRALRLELNDWASRVDEHHGYPYGTTNSRLMRRFGKSRSGMSPTELEEVRAHLLLTHSWLAAPRLVHEYEPEPETHFEPAPPPPVVGRPRFVFTVPRVAGGAG